MSTNPKYKIEINRMKNGYTEAKLIDTASNNPIEFRICDSEEYLQTQMKEWQKRFKMNEPQEP